MRTNSFDSRAPETLLNPPLPSTKTLSDSRNRSTSIHHGSLFSIPEIKEILFILFIEIGLSKRRRRPSNENHLSRIDRETKLSRSISPISKRINLSLSCDVVNNRFVPCFSTESESIVVYLVIEQLLSESE